MKPSIKGIVFVLAAIGLGLLEFAALLRLVHGALEPEGLLGGFKDFGSFLASLPDRMLVGWLLNFATAMACAFILAFESMYKIAGTGIERIMRLGQKSAEAGAVREANLTRGLLTLAGIAVVCYFALAMALG